MHILNFTDHRRQLLQNRYVYAVVSRRAKGLSIGINLNVDKGCNFDCPYCQVDRSVPLTDTQQIVKREGVDILKLQAELVHLFSLIVSGDLWRVAPFDTVSAEMQVLRDVSISGDGEPTMSPVLASVVGIVKAQLADFGLTDVAFNLFSNATLFHKDKVRNALNLLWSANGRVWAKLDAGTQEWFERVDGTKVSLDLVCRNILWASQQHPIVLQCMFHRFGDEGPSDEEIKSWVARIAHIVEQGGQIDWVQIYTTARKPADPSVLPLSVERLNEIRTALMMALGEQSEVLITVST